MGAPPFPLDSDGFCIFTPVEPSGEGSSFASSGTRKVYCSAQSGSSSNPGTEALPVRTINDVYALMRDGFPDWGLFKKNDVWTDEAFGNIPYNIGGRSSIELMMFMSYGESTGKRPLFKVNTETHPLGIASGGNDTSNNVGVAGLNFYSYRTNPSDPDFSSDYVVNTPFDTYGIRFGGKDMTTLVVTDCEVSYFVMNMQTIRASSLPEYPIGEYWIYRNVVHHCWKPRGDYRAQGLFIDRISYMNNYQNTFYNNGWNEWDPLTRQDNSHNIYNGTRGGFHDMQENFTILACNNAATNNNGASIINNFSYGNATGMQLQKGVTTSSSGGSYPPCVMQYNVIMASQDLLSPPASAGGAMGVGLVVAANNTENGTPNSPVTIDSNIVAHTQSISGYGMSFFDSLFTTAGDVTITNNIIFEWNLGIDVSSSLWTNVSNIVDLPGDNTQGYIAPNRTLGDYAGTIGLATTEQAFFDALLEQRQGNWNPLLMADPVNEYFREGFTTGGSETIDGATRLIAVSNHSGSMIVRV